MSDLELEQIEITLLLEAVFQRYGHDFRSYARASVERRIKQFLADSKCASVSDLIPRVLHDRECFLKFIRYFSIPVTELFRDPSVYAAIREKVIPLLKTWPYFKIWHAGCASGEEVYSMAIVLKEEGIYDRATIYATDFNDSLLAEAREGIYGIDKLREATRNYQKFGGKASLSEYYHARYNAAAMDDALKTRITFANHNLAVDNSFGEMQLVVCRNVLIYFNRDLQNRALRLFTESLVNGGFLCIGVKEDLQFSDVADKYGVVDEKARIYKKLDFGDRG